MSSIQDNQIIAKSSEFCEKFLNDIMFHFHSKSKVLLLPDWIVVVILDQLLSSNYRVSKKFSNPLHKPYDKLYHCAIFEGTVQQKIVPG